MYQTLDKKLNQLKKSIWKQYSRMKAALTFDELNVINRSKKLYEDLNDLNQTIYLEVARKAYKDAYPESDKELSPAWLLLLLQGYDEVTKYVYQNEVDRKRARFAESLLSTKRKQKEFVTAFNLWCRQTAQYGIKVVDEATLQAFRDAGIKRIRWKTQQDGKVCKSCQERNNKIYPINKIPTKPHYNCRCWFEKVEE